MTTIGFIGVGTMGGPMAANLLRAGHQVNAFDLDREALGRVAKQGAAATADAASAAKGAEIVITMLPNGEHVEKAIFGEKGIAETLSANALLIDMSTIAPAVTDRIGKRLAERGHAMIDAPVGRSSKHAEEGKLLIMIGGAPKDVERARPFLACLGDTLVHCGPLGTGGRMKVVNNYMSISLNLLTAEALVLAEAAGLTVEQAREVMLGTVAGQGHMGTTYPAKVLRGDLTPGFMIDLAHKDLGLALDLGASLNVPMLTGAVAREAYGVARGQGRGRADWTALYQSVRDLARLP